LQGSPADPHRAFHFHNGENGSRIVFGLTIVNGYATEGGAILLENGSSPLINNCYFIGNDAVDGGAVVCKDSSSPRLTFCAFEGNSASNRGGGLYCRDGCTSWVWNCRFYENSAGGGDGGGAYIEHADMLIEECRFNDNDASNGGAVCLDSSMVDFEFCSIYDNLATVNGGGVCLRDTSAGSFLSCTLARNMAYGSGSGIHLGDAASTAALENSIVAFGNSAAAVTNSGGPVPDLDCCDIYGNAGGPGCVATLIDTCGNIALNPLFCFNYPDDFSLRDDSPCIPYSLPNDSCNWIGKVQSINCTAPSSDLVPGQNLPGVWEGDAQWVDLDADGDQDLALCGKDGTDTARLRIYDNDEATLTLTQELTGIRSTGSDCLAWGDVNGDGLPDLAASGTLDSGDNLARVYVNNGAGELIWEPAHVLEGLGPASLAWGDLDNDGDLDLVTVGHDGVSDRAILYRNEYPGPLVPDYGIFLTGVRGGSADWVDLDSDGDLDLFLTGANGSDRRAIFYRNEPVGNLVEEGDLGVTGIVLGDTDWGDFNLDGYPDLVATGETGVGGPRYARIYENLGGGGLGLYQDLAAIYRSSCAWGDYDNDGDPDVIISGYTGTSLVTSLYLNEGGTFVYSDYVTARYEGSLSWVDLNRNGKLDLLVTGYNWYDPFVELYEHTGGAINTRPSPPTELFCEGSSGLALSWSGATDAQTAAAGLCYNVRVGTTPGGCDVCTGLLGSKPYGNVGQGTGLTLNLPDDTYYWSVQTIDPGRLASPWAPEQICAVGPLSGAPDAAPLSWRFDLEPNYPNPFNPTTTIRFTLTAAGPVQLAIYDSSGRLVRRLVDGARSPGRYAVTWDGRDERGVGCASGVYFCRLETREKRETSKMVLVR
ncbi:MAG: FG-GAP-like repeat-containing protein, partial [bacterium]